MRPKLHVQGRPEFVLYASCESASCDPASLRVASLRVPSLRVASLRVASLRVARLRVCRGGGGAAPPKDKVNSNCTEVCDSIPGGKSCAKICKVVVYTERAERNEGIPSYAVVDDQSNSTLAKAQLFDQLGITSPPTVYNMRTCAGYSQHLGRGTSELWIRSIGGNAQVKIPFVRECEDIPGTQKKYQRFPTNIYTFDR